MKSVLISTVFFCILSCNETVKKDKVATTENLEKVVQTIDSTGYKAYIANVFGNSINGVRTQQDSILFYGAYSCKYEENKPEKHVSMRFKDCNVVINSFELDSAFELLKTNSWLEEALPHQDFYYQKDQYIVVFDYLKYCDSSISKEYFLETIRIYGQADYFELAKTSYSADYALKKSN